MRYRLAIAAVITAVLGLVATPQAQAIPTNCQAYGKGSLFYKVQCWGGTGQYQAYANCHNDFWPWDAKMAYGPWTNPQPNGGNIWSVASCGSFGFTYKVYVGGWSVR